MLREFSSVFIAAYMLVLLVLVMEVHNGPNAFTDFRDTLQSPWLIAFNVIAFNVIALLFALLHTATWFLAVPSALQLRRGEEKVPPRLLIGAAYGLMLGASAILLALFLV
jgi:fumarate reductase subunit C